MRFLKAILNAILTIVGFIVVYILISLGHALIIWFFAPDSWNTEKIIAVSGSLFALIGVVQAIRKLSK
jgi:hypothetical protein